MRQSLKMKAVARVSLGLSPGQKNLVNLLFRVASNLKQLLSPSKTTLLVSQNASLQRSLLVNSTLAVCS